MRAVLDPETGLTAQQEKFAQLIARGWSQSDAYRQAYETKTDNPETVWSCASRLAADIRVASRTRALLDAAKLSDILGPAAWLHRVLAAIEDAKADRNHNAIMAGLRMAGQAVGPLRENLSVSIEQRVTDVQLIALLSRGDAAKAHQLAGLIGTDDFGDESTG